MRAFFQPVRKREERKGLSVAFLLREKRERVLSAPTGRVTGVGGEDCHQKANRRKGGREFEIGDVRKKFLALEKKN